MLPFIKGIEAPQVTSVMFLTWVQPCGLPQVCASLEHRVRVADPRALDWHLLPCSLLYIEVFDNFPGHLGWNPHQTIPIRDPVRAYVPFFNSRVFPGTPDWSEGKLLCKLCVLKLMGRHALSFLRENQAQRRSRPLTRGIWE